MLSKVTTVSEFQKAIEVHGSLRAIARATGQSFHSVRKLALQAQNPVQKKAEPVLPPKEAVAGGGRRTLLKQPLPLQGVKRYLLTCAQNNTEVLRPLWGNLQALAEFYDAEIWVSRFTYVKQGLGALGDKAQIVKPKHLYIDHEEHWWSSPMRWDPLLEDYINDDMVEIAPNLIWCGHMNILPTARRPLSGLETYTGMASAIFPHVKIAMDTVPSLPTDPDKFIYTTGTVTNRNYIQRKAGILAEFHHCFGALLVEVDPDGTWWARQVNADSTGRIFDLDVCVEDGQVTTGTPVEGITWGDLHVIHLESEVVGCNWFNHDSISRTLKPRSQFIHDFLDFYPRNHHERDNYHQMLKRLADGKDDVEDEVLESLEFLFKISSFAREDTVVVPSNHDEALLKWLREANYKTDLINARFFLKCQLALTEAILRGEEDFYLIEYLWEEYDFSEEASGVKFLRVDDSYILCQHDNDGVESGMHGHLGPNGSRGGVRNLARCGRRATIGHTHTASIIDGLYSAGLSAKRNLGYNRGPGSWSWTHVVTYENGKRSQLVVKNGRWRGGQLSSK